jgi:hypothetical protein
VLRTNRILRLDIDEGWYITSQYITTESEAMTQGGEEGKWGQWEVLRKGSGDEGKW